MQSDKLDALYWLTNWYKEHSYSINIDTVDNPGWNIRIKISQTPIEDMKILYHSEPWDDDDNWYGYSVKESNFHGSGDPSKLEILINSFRNLWKQYVDKTSDGIESKYPHSNMLGWLMKWYKDRCDGVWEHSYGVTIETSDDPGWKVTIELQETSLEATICDFTSDIQTDSDWYRYRIEDGIFYGYGDPTKLAILIECFKNLWEKRT